MRFEVRRVKIGDYCAGFASELSAQSVINIRPHLLRNLSWWAITDEDILGGIVWGIFEVESTPQLEGEGDYGL